MSATSRAGSAWATAIAARRPAPPAPTIATSHSTIPIWLALKRPCLPAGGRGGSAERVLVGHPYDVDAVVGCLLVGRNDPGERAVLHAVIGEVGDVQALEPI